VPDFFGGKEIKIDIKGITKKIEKKVKRLNKDYKVPYYIMVREGDADDILLYESKLFKADMLVIGASTKSKKKYLGTTAEKVAHKSHLPMLVVKNSAKEQYKNIVAPTDMQTQSKQSILFAKNIFTTAKLNVVHVSGLPYMGGPTLLSPNYEQYNKDAKEYAQKELESFMQDISIKKGKLIDGKADSKRALLSYINKGSYDLTVVGSRGTSGFKALIGSVASSILRETTTDVLVYVP
jgi:nucleotide-binding universal stress UspA family protein